MSTTIDAQELRAHLSDYLERAAHGEEILVLQVDAGGRKLPVRLMAVRPEHGSSSPPRRRFRSDRSVAEVLAEDRGA
ncbi:type II toxin-antitoxin system prevent-host-death family antitoxin [Egibacter rhizosphaerae]|uniref:Type II toxin-antitoxin system prevent-host-death family antitoxin n=1 Tax=Egibacter rhizosphaerae TaxID=1670831 RepID=A0A411YI17_9ACTN|nr:type II toxin-antitoxin system prevent-host-death family antitoxin [Egibacter rhizosphaerae]QBI20761.1 type II toxin-antitoxin system prevent-host-death family antitoxin [Egibacter rhizosphaerae]